MSVLRVTPDAPAPRRAVELLRTGGVIVFPTDTVYGLGCDATDAAAVRRVFAIKGRTPDQPVPILLADPDDAEGLAFITPAARLLMDRFWPGPLTIVLRARDRLPDIVTAGTGNVGLRVPDHAVPRSLARELGRPLVGTSANVHGQPPATSVVQVLSQLDGRPDLILDGGRCRSAASTVVDCTAQTPRVLRPGPISEAEVLAAAG
ncbi:MAG: L-threonylcarbamoyladenylate synthase [Armatimonadota bacterium]|nr:L-threonylcarbamoyladenylate synthase [Armatimonadota bacterium]MDR5696094.1 L-threonylcarbamoyladenylate synthase [Armatimonadota bacterium]